MTDPRADAVAILRSGGDPREIVESLIEAGLIATRVEVGLCDCVRPCHEDGSPCVLWDEGEPIPAWADPDKLVTRKVTEWSPVRPDGPTPS